MRNHFIHCPGVRASANRETDLAMIEVPISAVAGSSIAIVGGLWAAAPPLPDSGPAALIVAAGGLITALASLVVPIANAWIVARSAERKAKWERHNLANKLQATMLELAEVRETVNVQQTRIHVLEGVAQDQRETLVLIATKRERESADAKEPPRGSDHAAR